MAGVYCHQCGHRNPLGARFCASCGVELATSTDERTENLDALVTSDAPPAPGMASLVVTEGHRSGARWLLEGERVMAGRSGDSDVFLDDITVSRRHAELTKSGEAWRIVDVGSLNGTYVNGKRVDAAALTNGDELQIGKFKLVFIQREATAQP
jgi:hypothetical protein